MTGSRPARIWGLVAGQAASRGGRVSAGDACAAAVAAVEVSGAWLIAARGAEAGHLMRVTDEVSELLAELQLTLGEGPGLDAATSGGPVLASDMDEVEAVRRSRRRSPRRHVRLGRRRSLRSRCRWGRSGPGSWACTGSGPATAAALSSSGDALVFADTATLLMLDAQDQTAGEAVAGSGPGGQPPDLALHRAEIDQATGMLTEQLGVGIAEAFIRLRAYAYAHDRGLSALARDIVARRLRLSPDRDPRQDGQV